MLVLKYTLLTRSIRLWIVRRELFIFAICIMKFCTNDKPAIISHKRRLPLTHKTESEPLKLISISIINQSWINSTVRTITVKSMRKTLESFEPLYWFHFWNWWNITMYNSAIFCVCIYHNAICIVDLLFVVF